MIIKNKTDNSNIIISTLKKKAEEPDVVLRPNAFIDTKSFYLKDEDVKGNLEIQSLLKANKIEFLDSYPTLDAKAESEIREREKKDYLKEIASTFAISELTDLIKTAKDKDIIIAAQNRLIELTGDGGADNPELDGMQSNPIIS